MIKPKILLSIVLPVLLGISGGWYLLTTSTYPSVQAEEGYAEFNWTVECEQGHTVNMEKNVSAITVVNNGQGNMNLTVEFLGYGFDGHVFAYFDIYAAVNLPPSLKPTGFMFVADMPDNGTATVNFATSYDKGNNATAWPDDRIYPGAWAPNYAYVGFTPQSSHFIVKSYIQYEVYNLTASQPHTLRIKAVILGYKNPVAATIEFVLEPSWYGGDAK